MTNDADIPAMRPYSRHILICENSECADPAAAARLQRRLLDLARAHGLTKLRNPLRIKCSLTGCLGVCGGGPIVVVYPDAVWYHHVDEPALERIFQEHILKGRPVAELRFHEHSPADSMPAEPGSCVQDGCGGDVAKVLPDSAGTQLHSTPEAIARRQAARAARQRKGLVIVNTGNGKGKTTAALGMLLRAWGRAMRVGGVQFFKHENASFGELRALATMGLSLKPMGDGFTWTSRDIDQTRAKALHGWELAKQQIASGEYELFLLDEFTYLLHFGWLDTAEVVDWLRQHKPPLLHLVITGRDAPQPLIDFADLVTEMREIKHPLRDQGIRGQKGVEF